MNSAAIRLLGSSVFCLRDASLSNLLRVAAVACGVLRWMIRRSFRAGVSLPVLASAMTSWGCMSWGRARMWAMRSNGRPSGRVRLSALQPTRTMTSASLPLSARNCCMAPARAK